MPAEVWVVGVLLVGNCRRAVPFSQQTKWINGVGQTSYVQHCPRFPFSVLFSTLCQRHRLFGKLLALVYDILPPTTAITGYAIDPVKLSANRDPVKLSANRDPVKLS